MREFFRGWRRKVGCVTLVMACAVFTVWGRSYVVMDGVVRDTSTTSDSFDSRFGSLSWERTGPFDRAANPLTWTSAPADYDRLSAWVRMGVEPQFEWCGFEVGVRQVPVESKELRIGWWICPYMFLALPLTLLSAALILHQPRKRDSTARPPHA